MPLKLMPMDEVCAQLDANFPDLEYEADRHWIWITSDLAPLHKGQCSCPECQDRMVIRRFIGREGLGFSFAPNGHECPSGAIGFWGHRCEKPTRFKRRNKGITETQPAAEPEVSDDELLNMLG